MIEVIIALLGSAIAGMWDLFTTEVPGDVPYFMIFIGIAYWFVSGSATGNFYPLFLSLFLGTFVLAAGLLLYRLRQWGEADAWILAAVVYLIPIYGGSVFLFSYLPNMIVVGAAYVIIYAVVIGARNGFVLDEFKKDIRKNILMISSLLAALLLFLLFVAFSTTGNILPALQMFFITAGIVIFWRYGKVIEGKVFRKKIPVSELKAGDVLEGNKWIGLTEEEIKKIKSSKKYVVIKEGARFVPVFPIALAITLLYGKPFVEV